MFEPKSPSTAADGRNHREEDTPGIRPFVRPALFLAALVLLAGSACVPPIAFHDGLPA